MTELPSTCADCRAPLPRTHGSARTAVLASRNPPRRRPASAAPSPILFADLAGFTKLTSEIDAEEVHRLLGRFFELVDGAIARSGGTVDKHIGDATMAVFGAPVAHGNDIERAVRAACEIHEAMATLSAEAGKPLATHIGIASGEVVAASTGSAVRADYTVTGDAVNLASRLEELAGAGETIVSDDVRAALGSRLDAESRGSVAVRGFAHELPVWRVLALRAPEAERHRLVGRAHELLRTDAALDALASARHGATIALRGDPGSASRGWPRRCWRAPSREDARRTAPSCSTSARPRGATPPGSSRDRCSTSARPHRPPRAATRSIARSRRGSSIGGTSRSSPTCSGCPSARAAATRRWTTPGARAGASMRLPRSRPPRRASARSPSSSRTFTGRRPRSSTRSWPCASAPARTRSFSC
jgi:class 3 adenylate cyclase